MNKTKMLLLIDNGAYEIKSVFNGKALSTQPNIAFRIPSSLLQQQQDAADQTCETAGATAAAAQQQQQSAAPSQQHQQKQWIVGDAALRVPFPILSRCRGKRPLSTGLGGVLTDAPLQARIWQHLIYTVARIESEATVDLVVTVAPGTPKEVAVLWYTLCFVLFRFNSVTFVASGWLRYLGFSTMAALSSRAASQATPATATATATASSSSALTSQTSSSSKQQHQPQQEDDDHNNLPTCALVVDVSHTGVTSHAVLNSLPRRRGCVRQHLGMAHVGLLLARVVSFTQMDIASKAVPDLLVHRGMIDNGGCVRCRSSANESLERHLCGWEAAWRRGTGTYNPKENIFFQGSVRRRQRARDVTVKNNSNSNNAATTNAASTMWYVLPSEDAMGDASAAAAAAAANSGSKKTNKNTKNSKAIAAAVESTFGFSISNRRKQDAGSSEDDSADDDVTDSSDSDDSDDDFSSSEGDQQQQLNVDDELTLRLDHEPFVAMELLFQPRAICGETTTSANRLNAAFGSGGSSVGAVLAATAATTSTPAPAPAPAPAAAATATAASVPRQQIHGNGCGCVEALAQTRRRFAPELVAEMVTRVIVFGGATRVPGFCDRFAADARSAVASNLVFEFVSSDAAKEAQCLVACFQFLAKLFNNKNKAATAATAVATATAAAPKSKSKKNPKQQQVGDDDVGDAQKQHVDNFLFKSCQVTRAAVESALSGATAAAQKRSAHEQCVGMVFDAMQQILL